MDIVQVVNQVNEAGRAFCGSGCWAWIKAFMFIAVLALLLETVVKALNRMR